MSKKESDRQRPKHEVAEVIRKFEGAYLEKYCYTYGQKCVVNNILSCRTAAWNKPTKIIIRRKDV